MRARYGAAKYAAVANVLGLLDEIKHNEGRVLVPIDHSRDIKPHGSDVASSLTVRIKPDGRTEVVVIYDSDSRKRKFQLPGGRPTLRDGVQEPLLATATKEEVEEAFIQPERKELVLAAKFAKHNQILRDAADAENGAHGDVLHYIFMRISDAQIAETTDVDAKYPRWVDLSDIFTPGKRFQLGNTPRWAPLALSHVILVAKTLRHVGVHYADAMGVDGITPQESLYARMREELSASNPTIATVFAGWADISPWEITSGFITDMEKAQDVLDNLEQSPITPADLAKL